MGCTALGHLPEEEASLQLAGADPLPQRMTEEQ